MAKNALYTRIGLPASRLPGLACAENNPRLSRRWGAHGAG